MAAKDIVFEPDVSTHQMSLKEYLVPDWLAWYSGKLYIEIL